MNERYDQFTVLMTTINRNIKRIKSEEISKFDLKIQHVSFLYYLYKKKSLTSKQLCEICEEDKAAISRALNELQEKEFIIYHSKKYRVPIVLTEKGEEMGKIVAQKIDSILELASLGIDEEERQIMYKCLNRINENLNHIVDQYED